MNNALRITTLVGLFCGFVACGGSVGKEDITPVYTESELINDQNKVDRAESDLSLVGLKIEEIVERKNGQETSLFRWDMDYFERFNSLNPTISNTARVSQLKGFIKVTDTYLSKYAQKPFIIRKQNGEESERELEIFHVESLKAKISLAKDTITALSK